MNDDELKLFQEFLEFKKFKEAQESQEESKPSVKKSTKKRGKYTKRSDGAYQTSITIARDPETGKPIKEYIFAKTIAELEEMKAKILIEKGKGVRLDKQRITIKQYREAWIETKKIKLGHNGMNTIKMYESIFRNYFTDIDNLTPSEVTREVLQEILNINCDKKRQCQKIQMTFNEIFKSMVNDRILTFNPASDLIIAKYKSPEKRNLTEDENILSEVSDFTDRQKAFIYLIKYFGLRKEEALAVTKQDFDFANDTLRIHNAVVFDSNDPVYKDTKNTEERVLPIMPNVKEFFVRYIQTLQTDALITNVTDNNIVTNQGYNSMWRSIKTKMANKGKELGRHIEKDLSAHIFRHNYAYMLMDAGVDMKERQYLLGHKTIAMTMDIYTHIETRKMKAPEMLKKYTERNDEESKQ